ARAIKDERNSDDIRYPNSLFRGLTGVVMLVADLSRPEQSSMPIFESEGWPSHSLRTAASPA
ncbi:MAG: hypothetical protein ABJB74_21585, partial [Gemmatimonas sp.]